MFWSKLHFKITQYRNKETEIVIVHMIHIDVYRTVDKLSMLYLIFKNSYKTYSQTCLSSHLVSPATHFRQPYSWGEISFFYKPPSVASHLQMLATGHLFMSKSFKITCLCGQWPPYWKCDSIKSLIGWKFPPFYCCLCQTSQSAPLFLWDACWYTGTFVFWLHFLNRHMNQQVCIGGNRVL